MVKTALLIKNGTPKSDINMAFDDTTVQVHGEKKFKFSYTYAGSDEDTYRFNQEYLSVINQKIKDGYNVAVFMNGRGKSTELFQKLFFEQKVDAIEVRAIDLDKLTSLFGGEPHFKKNRLVGASSNTVVPKDINHLLSHVSSKLTGNSYIEVNLHSGETFQTVSLIQTSFKFLEYEDLASTFLKHHFDTCKSFAVLTVVPSKEVNNVPDLTTLHTLTSKSSSAKNRNYEFVQLRSRFDKLKATKKLSKEQLDEVETLNEILLEFTEPWSKKLIRSKPKVATVLKDDRVSLAAELAKIEKRRLQIRAIIAPDEKDVSAPTNDTLEVLQQENRELALRCKRLATDLAAAREAEVIPPAPKLDAKPVTTPSERLDNSITARRAMVSDLLDQKTQIEKEIKALKVDTIKFRQERETALVSNKTLRAKNTALTEQIHNKNIEYTRLLSK